MIKADIRKKNSLLRKKLTPAEVETYSKKIHDLFFSRIMVHRFSPIHVFMSIEKQKEPLTQLILHTLYLDFSPDVYTSVSLPEAELLHIPIKPGTQFKENKWDIPEPLNISGGLDTTRFFETYKNEDILVLVPLLGFDSKGHRVGYGQGFYDKFLEKKTIDTVCIGLSLLEAELEPISDTLDTDIILNHCITPSKVWTFAQK